MNSTHALRLERGTAKAELELSERRRARDVSGTTVYITDLDPDVVRVLTLRKVVDYLRRRRGPALARGDYQIEVIEGRRSEPVTPDEPDGIRLDIPARQTLWGRIEFGLYVAPRPDRRRRVAVAGPGGTTILDDLAEIEEFAGPPWTTDQVSGLVAFDALKQSAGRRAVLRDREAFPLFVDALRAIEPLVARTLDRVTREVDLDIAGRMNETVRRIFGRVLKELSDIDNPMRTALGSSSGQGAIFGGSETADPGSAEGESTVPPPGIADDTSPHTPLSDDDLIPAPTDPEETQRKRPRLVPRQAPRNHSRASPSILPRTAFVADSTQWEGIVYYNDRHADYLMVKADQQALLDYLATLVAKEYVVYNNPRAAPDDLAEEMVRMLVRVRRHLPRKT